MRNGVVAGNRYSDGSFNYRGINAYLWSSSDAGSSAWIRFLFYSRATEYRHTIDKSIGFSAIYKIKGE